MARTDPQLNIRIPAALKDALDTVADKNKRSTTAEIISRLQSTFKPEQKSLDFSSQPEFVEFRKEMLDQVRKMIAGEDGTVIHKSSHPVKRKS